MSSMSLSQTQPRRSSRLARKSSSIGLSAQPPGRGGKKATQSRNCRPRADQFCVYNKGPEGKVPAFIIEYKAPHKVSLSHIMAGLQDMDLDEVVRLQEEELPEVICRRVVAAVITQLTNLLLNEELHIKLSDFQGKQLSGDGTVLLDGLSGEPSRFYCPRADPFDADIKTDLFALGCTIYMILMGHPVFPDIVDGEDGCLRRFKKGLRSSIYQKIRMCAVLSL
ncbi:uncharacterized protein BDV17DRAFT_252102 [Aspergillus undulatus]|uniref:uncharacterized protein n=1 Tax=Aspergillus undulatus TaxID=1810928 RepID=UPI003CCE155B